MKRIVAAVALFAAGAVGSAVAGSTALAGAGADNGAGGNGVSRRTTVSEEQYETLLGQCRYANTARLRADCRATVRSDYRVGRENPDLDCREYSGVAVCGKLELSPRERRCVKETVGAGLSPRRAEVECYAFS